MLISSPFPLRALWSYLDDFMQIIALSAIDSQVYVTKHFLYLYITNLFF